MKVSIYRGCADPGWCCDELRFEAPPAAVELDLTDLTFVGPLFLVRLRAWLDHHAIHGATVTVRPPADRSVANYMSRMHVTAGLPKEVTFPLPVVRENPRGDRLIPLTRLAADGSDDFDDLLGDLLRADDMRHAGFLAEPVIETAQEMVNNAVAHGANDVGAYVAAQRFEDRGTDLPHRCVLAIGDVGIGMAEHLRRGDQGRGSDNATIAHGMTEMVSGTGDPHRGRGYEVPFDVARVASAWVDLRVRANAGWVTRRNDRPPVPLAELAPCAGTWVEFQFAHATPPGAAAAASTL